jgi:hypothetical protein
MRLAPVAGYFITSLIQEFTTMPTFRRTFFFAALSAVLLLSPAVAPAQSAPSAEELEMIRAAVPDAPFAAPAAPRRVLVFYKCEGYVHAAIPYGNEALRAMGEKSGAFTVELSDDMASFDAANLARFDAIVFNSPTHLSFPDPAHRAALLDFVRGGKGVAGIHAATDNFFEWPEAAEMMGGVFDGHPWRSNGTWAIKLDEPNHPLNAPFGGEGFMLNDEIYQMKPVPYSRDKLRILVSLDMANPVNVPGKREDNDYGISWVRRYGEGRVFYCSLGHNNHIFWNAAILKHYLGGIQYAIGDFKVDDAPSNKMAAGAAWMTDPTTAAAN